MPPGGISILKSTTGKPEGPHTHATNPDKTLLGGVGPTPQSFLIDQTLFEDEDGIVYFTQGPVDFIVRIKNDLSDFTEKPHAIQNSEPDTIKEHHVENCVANYQCEDLGFEGATLFKRNGTCYLGSADKYQARYSMIITTSKYVYGPCTGRYEAALCNGGTNFLKQKMAINSSVFFGDDAQAPWRKKPDIIKTEFDKVGNIKCKKTT